MTPEEHFEHLRQEILQWQSRRLTVLTAVLVVVPGILGWIAKSPGQLSWDIAAVFPLLFLACGSQLTWLFALNSITIGSYLELYCQSDWETRIRILWERFNFPNLNSTLSLVYLVLGVVSVALPAVLCQKEPTALGIGLFALALALYAASILNMAFRSYRRGDMISKWRSIEKYLESEEIKGGVPTTEQDTAGERGA